MTLSNIHEDVEKFLSMNDGLMDGIIYSQNKNLENSKKILQRIQRRDLYECVHSFKLSVSLLYENYTFQAKQFVVYEYISFSSKLKH